MINQEIQLKLQAYLDGELPDKEAAQITELLVRDTDAAALLGELRSLKAALVGGEVECKLPETREFFWSKIEREIAREAAVEVVPLRKLSWLAWLRLHILPMSGAALVSCLIGVVALRSGEVPVQGGEMELASDDMGAYTYRDQQAQMTTIWFYDRNEDSQFTDPSSLASVEPE